MDIHPLVHPLVLHSYCICIYSSLSIIRQAFFYFIRTHVRAIENKGLFLC